MGDVAHITSVSDFTVHAHDNTESDDGVVADTASARDVGSGSDQGIVPDGYGCKDDRPRFRFNVSIEDGPSPDHTVFPE